MIIVISGKPGAGKSTVAKKLAAKLKLPRISAGDFQRELAKERGITITELGELEKKDPALDKIVDQKTADYAKTHDNYVTDAWLGAKFVLNGFKIFLDGEETSRAKRIFTDSQNQLRNVTTKKYRGIDDVLADMRKRNETNRNRWHRFYNFYYDDPKHYDLVINTTNIGADEVVGKILKKMK